MLSSVKEVRKYVLYAKALTLTYDHEFSGHFGHPSGGFFFWRDCLIASFQLPSILSVSALGPRLAPARAAGVRFAAFFLVAISTIL